MIKEGGPTKLGKVTATFGQKLFVELPQYKDPEGDPILISIRDNKNPFLVMHASRITPTKFSSQEPFFAIRSEELVDGKNAKLGKSTINVTWTDSVTK